MQSEGMGTYGELLGVNNQVETADLGKSELLLVDTCSIDLLPDPEEDADRQCTFTEEGGERTHWVLPALRAASTAAWFSPR
jgi:hypothetical protein